MHDLLYKRYIRIIIFVLILIVSIGVFSYVFRELSFDFDKAKGGSYINWSTFSQFFAFFGTLAAVIIALFQENIKSFLNPTQILLFDNLHNDNNYSYNNHKVLYFFHLKAINSNPRIILNDFSVNLKAGNIYGSKIDIPRKFKFASSNNYMYDLQIEAYIDIFYLELEFSENNLLANIILPVDYENPPVINLLNNSKVEFPIFINSKSLNKLQYYNVILNIDREELMIFLERCKQKRDNYLIIKSNANNINEIENEYKFEDLHKLISISLLRINRG